MNMTNGIKAVLAFVIAAMVLSSCSEEQTSLSINDIQGRAKILGSLSYSEGQAYANGKFTELIKPAANTVVFVKVSNASLSPNGMAQGYTTYEVTTDESGKYEIEIPAVEKTSTGTSIIIQPQAFVGTRQLLKTMENGKPVFDSKEVVFEADPQSIFVKPNEIKVADLTYGYTERNIETGFPVTVPLTIKVGVNAFKRDQTSGSTTTVYNKIFRAQANIEVVITVDYSSAGIDMTRSYGATTDSKGEATFNIPAKEKQWSGVPITIKAMPFTTQSFTFYDSNNQQFIIDGGVYKQYYYRFVDNQFAEISFSGLEGVTAYKEIKMVFDPFAGAENASLYNEDAWNYVSFE